MEGTPPRSSDEIVELAGELLSRWESMPPEDDPFADDDDCLPCLLDEWNVDFEE